jgi:hypothetical protein
MGLAAVRYGNRMRRPVERTTVPTARVTTVPATTVPATTVPAARPAIMMVAVAAALDACCVLVFVIIGRHAHDHGDGVAGVWHTAWPFLAGLGVGLAVVRYWQRPLEIGRAGVGAWLGAAGAGMAIRVLAGQGTAAAFIAIASAFLALFLLGWRFVAMTANHLWRRRHRSSQRG